MGRSLGEVRGVAALESRRLNGSARSRRSKLGRIKADSATSVRGWCSIGTMSFNRGFLRFLVVGAALAARARTTPIAPAQTPTGPDTTAIVATARELASDAMRGRGPWSPEATTAARL